MRSTHCTIVTTVLSLCAATLALAADVPYLTGFEAADGFSTGNLDGQDSWFVDSGISEVQNSTTAHGFQAVRLDSGASIGVAISGGVGSVVWVDTFVRTSGTENAPVLGSMSERSSVIHFSSTSGIQALDGDGSGSGIFQSVGVFPSGSSFQRITLRQDYSAHDWDLYIDGQLEASSLGFKDNSINRLSGLRQYSEQTAYLDSVSATTLGITNDADGDGIVDLDETKFYDTDPNVADTDGDRRDDGDELIAGTDPADVYSTLNITVSIGDPDVQVIFNTVSGRLYTVQYSTDLMGIPAWYDVADGAWVDRVGTGAIEIYSETLPTTPRYYRVSVEKP